VRTIDAVRLQVLDVVQLREEATVVGCAESLEFLQSLAAEVGAVDQEEDSLCAGELDQTVEEIAGGIGLASSSGHLDERTTAALAERVFEVVNRCDLRRTEAGLDQRRHGLEPCFGRRAWAGEVVLQPAGEHGRGVEGKNGSAGGIRFQQVGEASFNTGRFVAEGQRADGRGNRLWNALAVLLGLPLEPDEGGTLLLGLNGPGCLAVHEEQVVGLAIAMPERKLPDGDARPSIDVGLIPILDDPSRLLKQAVDSLAGFLFWRQNCVRSRAPVYAKIQLLRDEVQGSSSRMAPDLF